MMPLAICYICNTPITAKPYRTINGEFRHLDCAREIYE